jgi:hypothetical protein
MFESVRPQIFIGPFFDSGAVSVFACAVRVGLIAAPSGLIYKQHKEESDEKGIFGSCNRRDALRGCDRR